MSARTPYVLKGDTGDWEVVMGLEIHAQVASNAKLFSGASTAFGADPNCNVSLVDAAMPGMLPVINRKCVEQAIRTGLGLKAEIHHYSRFDRKNYFYPDLPQGYQISQFAHPIVGEGEIDVDVEPAHGGEAYSFTCRIERLHLEQDAGKSIHDMDPNSTYVDLNRSGVALMEIVSKPDVRSPAEAAAYVKKIRAIVIALGTCDGDMDKGNLRADVNVSVCKPGQYEKFRETGDFSHLGTRCELKNMNSFRFIQQAIEYEARRQIEIIEGGGSVDQETRLFDPVKVETRSMRSKEDAHDYRYFPDPDLLPLEIEQAWIDEIKASLPALPDAIKEAYLDLKVQPQFARDLSQNTDVDQALNRKIWSWLVSEFGEETALLASIRDWREPKPQFDIRVPNLLEVYERHKDVVESDRMNLGADSSNARVHLIGVVENYVKLVFQHVFSYANEHSKNPVQIIETLDLAGLRRALLSGEISSQGAKELMLLMMETGDSATVLIEKHGLKQVTDTGAIEKVVDEIIAANPEQVEKVKEKPQTLGWFVGQVMKASGGKANPKAVNEILKAKLGV